MTEALELMGLKFEYFGEFRSTFENFAGSRNQRICHLPSVKNIIGEKYRDKGPLNVQNKPITQAHLRSVTRISER